MQEKKSINLSPCTILRKKFMNFHKTDYLHSQIFPFLPDWGRWKSLPQGWVLGWWWHPVGCLVLAQACRRRGRELQCHFHTVLPSDFNKRKLSNENVFSINYMQYLMTFNLSKRIFSSKYKQALYPTFGY